MRCVEKLHDRASSVSVFDFMNHLRVCVPVFVEAKPNQWEIQQEHEDKLTI